MAGTERRSGSTGAISAASVPLACRFQAAVAAVAEHLDAHPDPAAPGAYDDLDQLVVGEGEHVRQRQVGQHGGPGAVHFGRRQDQLDEAGRRHDGGPPHHVVAEVGEGRGHPAGAARPSCPAPTPARAAGPRNGWPPRTRAAAASYQNRSRCHG